MHFLSHRSHTVLKYIGHEQTRGALVSRLVSLHTASVQNELLKHAITHCTALRGRAEDLGEALQLLYEGVVVAASHVTGRSKTTLEAAKW